MPELPRHSFTVFARLLVTVAVISTATVVSFTVSQTDATLPVRGIEGEVGNIVPCANRPIDTLRAQAPTMPPIRTLPPERGGQAIIGRPLPKLKFDRVLAAPPPKAPTTVPATRPSTSPVVRPTRATLYRWWTNGCPYCEGSLPGIERLRRTYGPRGLDVVAVFHPKPKRAVDDETIRAYATDLGYHGRIAVDLDWSELGRTNLDDEPRRATSISILVDADGVVRFMHPGPILFPASHAKEEQPNADYELLEAAVRALTTAPISAESDGG